jgi:hypothetical protein
MRPNRSGCPANGKLRSAGGPCPLNYLENRDCRVRRRARLGNLSQQGCQLNQRRQRRNWRVRAVERGQRSEPAWLRAYPGLHSFEPEKPTPTQIPRNVWDRGTARTGGGVNYNRQRNLAKLKLAQFDPDIIRLTSHGKMLKTKSVHAHSGPEDREVRRLNRGTTPRASNPRQAWTRGTCSCRSLLDWRARGALCNASR